MSGIDRNGLSSWVVVGLVLLVLGRGVSAAVPSEQPTMEQLRAALVVTIARFVEWPDASFASPAAPLVIAVVSDESTSLSVEAVSRGRLVNGRPVTVRRAQWDSDLTGVHVLFVGEAERRRVPALLERVGGRPILTLSMLPDFGREGGMLTLIPVDGRVSFSVNSRAADGASLRLSSFLLTHAIHVSTDPDTRSRR